MGDKVLVVFLPDCHESLAGIIAGRVREHFHKPSIVLTRSGDMVKGSGRSIEPYHMFRELTKVRELLPKFGGHPMAAGLSIKEEDVPEFRRRLNENAVLTEEDFIPRVWIDVPMPLEYVTEGLVEELKRLEPFGQGVEKPLFAQKDDPQPPGPGEKPERGEAGAGDRYGAFHGRPLIRGRRCVPEGTAGKDRIDIVYYPDINEYNGNRTLQAVIRNYKAAG